MLRNRSVCFIYKILKNCSRSYAKVWLTMNHKPKHEIKLCARCGGDFECKVGDVTNCQCSEVKILPETYKFISTTHYDCLCKKCLEELNHLIKYRDSHPFPNQKELFIEGIHYYTESGYWVFTELYHLQRGHCCKNNCRHWAYGRKTETMKNA